MNEPRLIFTTSRGHDHVRLEELRDEVEWCLRFLTNEVERDLLWLHDGCGVPLSELAELLGCSVVAVRQKLYRAREEIRRHRVTQGGSEAFSS